MPNLLPPSEKKSLLQEWQKKLSIILIIELLFFLVCVLLVLLAIEFYILGEVSSNNFLLQQMQNNHKPSDFSNFKDIILKYNNKLILIDSFYKNQKFLSLALGVLLEIQKPEGVYFTKSSLQPDYQSEKIKVDISGFSDTRDNLLMLKESIKMAKNVESVNFSPESWISQKNINFNATLYISDDK